MKLLQRLQPTPSTTRSLPSFLIAFAAVSLTMCLHCGTAFAQSNTKSAEQEQEQEEEGFESLFDGESLEGWSGNPDLWTVADGAITGTTTEENRITKNQFITWTGGELKDFELRLKFKIANGNSGIQFRSKPVGEEGAYRVHGYQADIDPSMRYMGILFEEGGRKILAERSKKVEITAEGKKEVVGSTGDDAEIVAAIDATGWNEYTIRAEGGHIVQSINGKVCVDLNDLQTEKAAESGILAFQIHVGPPMVVQFKDIRLKKLGE